MAYQPKSYKKFVATAATATLVASAIVPVASAATFTDVNKNYTEAVNYLVANNIAQGTTETTFGTTASITRGDAAVMIANALKLDTSKAPASTFTDLNNRVKDSVNALYAAGIINGKSTTQFAPAEFITRAEMAKVIALAYKLDAAGTHNEFVDVNSTFDQYVDALVKNEITLGKTESLFGATQNVTRGEFALFVYRSETLTPATPEVVSVSAINAKQVEVKFNTAMDASTLVDTQANGYAVKGITLAAKTGAGAIDNADFSGELSKDGKTLTITNNDTVQFFDGDYTVTVQDTVKDAKGTALAPYITNISVDDSVAPTVTGVSYDAETDLVTVSLSEAIIANPDVLRVNGTPVAFEVATAPVTELTFARPAAVTTGSVASIYISGGSDYNGNSFAPFTGSVTITKDASALGVASLTQVDSDTVRVVFNKKLGVMGASALADVDAALTVLANGAPFTRTVSVTAGDTTGKSFDVNFTSANLYGAGTSQDLVLAFKKDGVVDVFGNKNLASSHSVKMTKDTVAPTLTTSSVSTDKKTITLTFSEEVSVDDTKFVVRQDGIDVDVSTLAIVSDTDKKKVLITQDSAAAFAAGTYSFRLEAGAVTDLVELNTNALTTTSVVVPTGAVNATNLVAAITNGGSNNVFEVTFTDNASAKEVTAASALNLSNYKLDGAVLPAGTDIYFTDTNKNVVVIELPANSVNIGEVGTGTNATLSVSGVKSTDNKTVVATSSTVKIEDNTSATITAAALVAPSVLKVSFTENVDATFADLAEILAELQVSSSVGTFVAGDATASATVSGKDLIITVTENTSNWSEVLAGSSLVVKTLDSGAVTNDGLTAGILDTNGLEVKANSSKTITK